MKTLIDSTDPSIWQQPMEQSMHLVHTRGGFRGSYTLNYALVAGVWSTSFFRHLEQEPFTEIILEWGHYPWLERHHEGPLLPWSYSLVAHLTNTLAEKPIFDEDHVGNAMAVLGPLLGFPCVEVRTEGNRAQWHNVPCVEVSSREFEPFISINGKDKLFPTNFKTGETPPYTVELGGQTCYVCKRSGNALVVRAIDFDLNS